MLKITCGLLGSLALAGTAMAQTTTPGTTTSTTPGAASDGVVTTSSGLIYRSLKAGSGDQAVIKAFEGELTDAFRKFKPELLIISAGFDAHEDDPLGGLGWTSEVYAKLTLILRRLCHEQGHQRIVSLLEGGYSERGITEGVRRHIEAMERESLE